MNDPQSQGRAAAWTARFQLGKVVATPGALRLLQQLSIEPLSLLIRHRSGDFGELCPEDLDANWKAIERGDRILSSFAVGAAGTRVWVLTDAIDDDGHRRCTTLLLPSEY